MTKTHKLFWSKKSRRHSLYLGVKLAKAFAASLLTLTTGLPKKPLKAFLKLMAVLSSSTLKASPPWVTRERRLNNGTTPIHKKT